MFDTPHPDDESSPSAETEAPAVSQPYLITDQVALQARVDEEMANMADLDVLDQSAVAALLGLELASGILKTARYEVNVAANRRAGHQQGLMAVEMFDQEHLEWMLAQCRTVQARSTSLAHKVKAGATATVIVRHLNQMRAAELETGA